MQTIMDTSVDGSFIPDIAVRAVKASLLYSKNRSSKDIEERQARKSTFGKITIVG